MNSLTTHYRRSQLIALPVPGGKAKVEYCYAVNVPGDREIVTHSFAEWAVGDFNRQKETVLCDKLTAGSKITTECPSESFVGSRKHNGLPFGECSGGASSRTGEKRRHHDKAWRGPGYHASYRGEGRRQRGSRDYPRTACR